MNVVILVPRRAGFPERDQLWKWCKAWWAENVPEYRIVEGHHDHGLFNRSAAINTAAAKAGAWDVALIIDSDVILDDPRQAIVAAHQAFETGKMVVAFTVRNNISRLGTGKLMEGHAKTDWDVEREYLNQHSSVVAFPHDLFDEISGFDEHFRGWGFEDTGATIAAETFSGPRITLPGICWHLWHDSAPEKRGSPARIANWNRVNRYRDSAGDKEAIRGILSEPPTAADEATIPRILHRVVPRETSVTSERWWAEFDALHPGWRLMTWRDPLDSKQFPITSHAWKKVKNGAQLADLVRLEVLLQWGGVYVDSDVQPFRNLNSLLPLSAFAAWEDSFTAPNAVMGARREHPAIQACLDMALERVEAGKGVWDGGPGVTTDIFPHRDDVLLLPPESFYPVHYKDPRRDKKMQQFDPKVHPATFAMHWYAASWLNDPAKRHPLP